MRGAGFDGLIGGSKQFNATARSVSKRVFKECEENLKKSVPKIKVPAAASIAVRSRFRLLCWQLSTCSHLRERAGVRWAAKYESSHT